MNRVTTRKGSRPLPGKSYAFGGTVVILNDVEVGYVWDKLYGAYEYAFPIHGRMLRFSATSRKRAIEQIVKSVLESQEA